VENGFVSTSEITSYLSGHLKSRFLDDVEELFETETDVGQKP